MNIYQSNTNGKGLDWVHLKSFDRFSLVQGYRATTRRQFTFNLKTPGVPGTQLIDVGMMIDRVELEVSRE